MRKCKLCGVEVPRHRYYCDPCKVEKARQNAARVAQRNRDNRIKTPAEARAAHARKITAEMELYRKCVPVIIAAYRTWNEYERAKIAALNPGLSFGAP